MKTCARIFGIVALFLSGSLQAQTLLFVSEYGTGNVRAYDYSNGSAVSLPAGYTPVGANISGADGMVTDAQGRLHVNRGDGTISRRSLDGNSFSLFATLPGANSAFYSLDLTRNSTHLFGAQFGSTTLYRTSLADATVTTISGPVGAARFDGVRVGPDGRLYAVDSSNGHIYAYDLGTDSWTTFLDNSLAGDASQLEFGADGRVFLSRTISNEARIYAYTLNTLGDYTSGLNSSPTLIGAYGSSGTATGIRIGPDGRLYANAFNAGEVWRSNVGITAMDNTAFINGLSEPGSLYFAAVPEPASVTLLLASLLAFLSFRRKRNH
jgi:streptogramin lyase